MLNVGRLNEGVVLDHIEAGKSMSIYKYLKLDKMDCCVAIIKNAHSNKMGKKDIIKVECYGYSMDIPLQTLTAGRNLDELDLNVLGFIDHRITVNIIQNGTIVAKKELNLPKKLVNIISCKNPRCITSIEQGLDQVFFLADKEREIYRCQYCEEKYQSSKKKK